MIECHVLVWDTQLYELWLFPARGSSGRWGQGLRQAQCEEGLSQAEGEEFHCGICTGDDVWMYVICDSVGMSGTTVGTVTLPCKSIKMGTHRRGKFSWKRRKYANISIFTGFAWWFYQYLCIRSILFASQLSSFCQFALCQWRAEKNRCHTCQTRLSCHRRVKKWQCSWLCFLNFEMPIFKKKKKRSHKSSERVLWVLIGWLIWTFL